MAKDTRPYFTLTNEYPRHRKIRTLSDKAFRLHVELIADCNEAQSDGKFSKHELNMRGTKAGKELIDAGLVEETKDGYQLHDYLSHQHSRQKGHTSGITSKRVSTTSSAAYAAKPVST